MLGANGELTSLTATPNLKPAMAEKTPLSTALNLAPPYSGLTPSRESRRAEPARIKGARQVTRERPPRRRQSLAHGEPPQRADRAHQMQAGGAQRLQRQEITEQRTVRQIDRESPTE